MATLRKIGTGPHLPLILAGLTLAGLFDALLLDGALARASSWALLAAPIATALWIAIKSRAEIGRNECYSQDRSKETQE